jgi:hypothetical protein
MKLSYLFKAEAVALLDPLVNRRTNLKPFGWLAPTARPAHGGTEGRPAL